MRRTLRHTARWLLRWAANFFWAMEDVGDWVSYRAEALTTLEEHRERARICREAVERHIAEHRAAYAAEEGSDAT